MTIDDSVKLIDAVTKLLGVLAWPALLVFVFLRFGRPLKEFFSSLGEFSLKGAGFEATAKRKQAAAANLVAASVARLNADTTPELAARNANNAKEAAEVVAEAVTPRVIRRAREATVLWVDDRPDNNILERQSLEALGVSFVVAESTDAALSKIAKQKFDVIISDMSRPPDLRAGYTLLEKLRNSGNRTPFVIYSGSNAPEHKTEARSRGAMGSTNRASELFSHVLTALNGG